MGEPDIGEAVEYILAERPRLDEEDVWAVLMELGDPPPPESDGLAVDLIAGTRPGLGRRDVKLILREWRAYASLAEEGDWE
ncbi:MAG: hypothetical protein MUE51_08045 [Thermoleophilia bacterium]|jgi:hypothetical protein|nr:hypothetical protein [Thermoleophilia bacterium]